jgi:phosphoglycolate phosphatase-like HAD superfamily hydrolase
VAIAIFDIDGTLTDTVAVDAECYEAAVRVETGVEIPSNWREFDEINDRAILETACRLQRVEPPSVEAQWVIADRVASLLAEAWRREPQRFRPIPGAAEALAHVRSRGWGVGIATGAWRPSALFKLEAAGLFVEGVPIVTASEAARRSAIIRLAVEEASTRHGGPAIYIGDGVWDGRAARELGLGFVGVGEDARSADLERAGASAVVPDFQDLERLDRALIGAFKSALLTGREVQRPPLVSPSRSVSRPCPTGQSSRPEEESR